MIHRATVFLVLVALVSGCGGPGQTTGAASPTGTSAASAPLPTDAAPTGTATATESPSEAPSPSEAATEGPTTAPTEGPTPAPSAGEGEFLNPVIDADFPDPHVIREGDLYYAYATTGGGKNLQAATSSDLVTWDMLPDPLPQLASWSGMTPLFSDTPHKATWAPAAAKVGDTFILYYTTPALDIPRPDGRPSQCIGVAVADAPEGPFVDESEGPIVCQAELGGSIDSTYFRDEDGKQYLIWKNDGNCCGIETRFYIQELTRDGRRLRGEPTDLGVDNDTTWEQFVIEAPSLMRSGDTYYLFFSGNDFSSAAYAVGYATSSEVTGPYTDAEENPILATVRGVVAGPGHQSILTDRDGDLWMTYHAWDVTAIGYQNGGRRAMWIDELVFEDGRAQVLGPDLGPQPVP